MKGFVAAIITLSLLIGIVIWNGIWINGTINDLLNIIEEIPTDPTVEGTAEKCGDLKNKWLKCEKIIKYSISHTEIESISSKIAAIVLYAENGNKNDFTAQLIALEDELRFLKKSESLSIDGIL